MRLHLLTALTAGVFAPYQLMNTSQTDINLFPVISKLGFIINGNSHLYMFATSILKRGLKAFYNGQSVLHFKVYS